MAMTDLDSMTLGELESVAARMRKAADDIRAAQALFSGSSKPVESMEPQAPIVDGDAVAAHRRKQFQPVEASKPSSIQTDPRAFLSPAELAERQRLLGRSTIDKNLPEDMQALEGQ